MAALAVEVILYDLLLPTDLLFKLNHHNVDGGVKVVRLRFAEIIDVIAGDVAMGTLAQRNFTIVRSNTMMFDVIARLRRRNAVMAVVVRSRAVPRADDVVGVITKEHVADEVTNSIGVYPR